MNRPPSPSTSIPVEKLGPPGVRGELHVLAIFENESRTDQSRLHDTSSREFKVSARLSKFPAATEGIKGDFTEKDGNSYLLVPERALFSRLRCPEGMFDLKKNDLGEISLIEFACTATSTKEARAIFLRGVLPFLDHLVFLTNSPLFISSLRVEDLKNHRTALDFISPYRSATVNPHEG